MVEAIEQWQLRKAVAKGRGGVVAAQHYQAAHVGADVLAAGGNAVDAAVATAFALAVLEPWMSGVGGGGYMVVYLAKEQRVQVVDFAMTAPRGLDPAAFPLLTDGVATNDNFFGWPAVEGERNVHGPLSIAVPGSVDGLGLASERFGRLPWAELLRPAIGLAREGHPVNWWTTLEICDEAKALSTYPAASRRYLPGGFPPLTQLEGVHRLPMDELAQTLDQLARAGRRDFYEGDLAASLARDLAEAGSFVTAADLAAYNAHLAAPLACDRGQVRYFVPPGLCAGPTFADALAQLPPIAPGRPGSEAYLGYGRSLMAAYERRFAEMGHDGDRAGQGCTTHLSVADGEGNLVALTNTLLSLFGSKVEMPESGVMMNNGIMWFDPRPGRPNSIAPGQRPLCNMCPMVATKADKPWFAMGASGGRRILSAVYHGASFLADCGLSLEQAVHQPRLNVDGAARVEADLRLGSDCLAELEKHLPLSVVEAQTAPNRFANLQVALFDPDGDEGPSVEGASQIRLPVAGAVAI